MGAAARRVVTGLQHGDIWLAELDKLRPVLVAVRGDVADRIGWVPVVPITSTSRRLRSHLPLGIEHGLDQQSWANFDAITTIGRDSFVRRLGSLNGRALERFCATLAYTFGC